MKAKIAAASVIVIAIVLGAVTVRAQPKGPQQFEATPIERAAVAGIEAQQRELNTQGQEVVAAAKARLNLPASCRFGWDAQAARWTLYADPAPVAVEKTAERPPVAVVSTGS